MFYQMNKLIGAIILMSCCNAFAASEIQVPAVWNKFAVILQARLEQPQAKMKLTPEQSKNFTVFLNNLQQPTPELLQLQTTLPKTTLELLRSVESRDVQLSEAAKMAAYLQIVPEKYNVKNITAFDENTSHIIGRDWNQIDYGGEGMTWEKQQLKYKPYGITNFKTVENLSKFFPVESELPYFSKVYS
jgi:hypothetical protein